MRPIEVAIDLCCRCGATVVWADDGTRLVAVDAQEAEAGTHLLVRRDGRLHVRQPWAAITQLRDDGRLHRLHAETCTDWRTG